MPFIDVEDNYGGPRLDLPACFYANTLQSVYAMEDMTDTNSGKEVGHIQACLTACCWLICKCGWRLSVCIQESEALLAGRVMLCPGLSMLCMWMQALLHLRKAVSPEFGPDVSPLRLSVDESLPDILHVKITDAEGKRWQVPRSLLADSASDMAGAPTAPTATLLFAQPAGRGAGCPDSGAVTHRPHRREGRAPQVHPENRG